jgi:DNA-binding MarR family transcriptional regulator
MWTWPFDESHQSLVIATLGFMGAFLLMHYYLSFRSRMTEINGSSSHDFIESVLSQYSAKFAAATKIIEDITLRLEFVERALEHIHLGSSKSKVSLRSTNKFDNLSLLSNVSTNEQDENSGIGDIGDISSDICDTQAKKNNITKLDEIQSHDYQDSGDITNMSALILKLLSKKSMNTIEIQSKVRRTREHTSRFMKRLFLQGLVSREMHTKPFVYTLTDEGRKQLKAFHNDV